MVLLMNGTKRPMPVLRDVDDIVAADLPPPDTTRWVPRRKAVVVAAVRAGLISLQEACRRYNLSIEEFSTWERAIDDGGVPALRNKGIDRARKRSSRPGRVPTPPERSQ